MKCKVKIKDHAIDKCIEQGITDKELNEGIMKGARRIKIKLNRNKSKEFITYKFYEIVCISQPCRRDIVTIY